MMEMIANYGNPISPQPPLPRSFEEQNPADLRGPSFQDYLKSPADTDSYRRPQENAAYEPAAGEPASAAERSGKDDSVSPSRDGGMKEQKEAQPGGKDSADYRDVPDTGRSGGGRKIREAEEKRGPAVDPALLKKGLSPQNSAGEAAPENLKKMGKEAASASAEEESSRLAVSPGKERSGEADSLLTSLSGSAASTERALEELAARRESRKESVPGGEKVRPAEGGSVKNAGASASEVTRLKVTSAENPEQGIEIELTDTRSRHKITGAEQTGVRRGGGEAVNTEETQLNRPEAPRSADGETGNVKVMELGGDSQERSGTPAAFSAKETKSAAASFGEILREKGIGQVVRQTGILLKDDNRGEIKLILKPEALGKVRIQLNLEDNRIAGRILVENSSVRDAFNQNIEELQRALRESGFESAHLEVSVEGEAAGQNQEGRRDPLRNQRMIAHAIEEGLPGMITLQREESLVNLMA